MARLNYVKKFRGTSKTSDGNLHCGSCRQPIKKGDSYRWWANRTPGARSGYRQNRCMKGECTPKPWEYQTNSPHIAALMMAEDSAFTALSGVELSYEDPSGVADAITEAVQGVAEGVREAAEGYEESAQNIEDGFGHSTYVSEELAEKADTLTNQADEAEQWEPSNTDPPEREEFEGDGDEDDGQDDYQAALDSWFQDMVSEGEQAISEACEQS